MASRVARLPNMCVFCAMNTSRLVPRAPALRTLGASPRLFSTSAILSRSGGKKIKKVPEHHFVRPVKYPRPPKAVRKGVEEELLLFEPEEEPVYDNEVTDEIIQQQVAYSLAEIKPHNRLVTDKRFSDLLPVDVTISSLEEKWPIYESEVLAVVAEKSGEYEVGSDISAVPTKRVLETTYRTGGSLALSQKLFVSFLRFAGYEPSSMEKKMIERINEAADIRHPQEWYFSTRQFQRTWHLHVGPTNSGKTYHALKRLEETGNGMYAGPLRLLAHEVWERLNSKGLQCDLVTGDDIRISNADGGKESLLTSATMEMVSTAKEMDVCVIDEIQMIGDTERGWAWTQAVLGVKAKELHLCGEERVVPLIKKLAASVGDKLIVHQYKRLGPLQALPESLGGDLTKIEKGDCVVTFSRRNIFAMKRSIEEATGLRCAVVYGSLPPSARSTQAALFNDPNSEYDVLVASDAVGMGLNLSIKRVIFEAVAKWNGTEVKAITVPQLKQIAGRAGRYKAFNKDAAVKPEDTLVPLPAAPQVGYVTTLEKADLKAVATSIHKEVAPLKSAGILPNAAQFIAFAAQFPPDQPFSKTIKFMGKYLQTSGDFHICNLESNIKYAELFDKIPLSISDRLTFINAPIGRNPKTMFVAQEMAKVLAEGREASALDIEGLDVELLDNPAKDATDLNMLETLHKSLILYIWLAIRYPATFTPFQTAEELKDICEKRIEEGLNTIKFTRTRRVRGERLAGTNIIIPETSKPKRNEDGSVFGKFTAAPTRSGCFICGSTDHVKSDCPRKISPEKMICQNCGLKGHSKHNCTFNVRNNSTRKNARLNASL